MNQHLRLASAPAGERSIAAPAAMLAFATAVIVTTEFIVVGLLPQMARDLQISVVEAGGLVWSFALASALFGPPLTMLAARAEPRRVFEAVLLVFALGNAGAALAPSYGLVLAVRVVEGAALPVLVSVGSAVIARLAGPGREGWGVGLLYLGVVVAIVAAVPGGVMLADGEGWRTSFALLAFLAALALVLARAFPRLEASDEAPLRGQAAILRLPALRFHLVLSALLATAMFTAYTYLAAFLESVAGFDGRAIALALAGFGVAGVFGNWLAGHLVDRGPTVVTAAAAFILMLATAAASLAGGELLLLLPVLGVWGAVHTALFLLCQVRVMALAPSAPAFASSLNIAAGNAGIAAGAVVGGLIVDHLGIAAIGAGAAAIAAVALALAIERWRRGDP